MTDDEADEIQRIYYERNRLTIEPKPKPKFVLMPRDRGRVCEVWADDEGWHILIFHDPDEIRTYTRAEAARFQTNIPIFNNVERAWEHLNRKAGWKESILIPVSVAMRLAIWGLPFSQLR